MQPGTRVTCAYRQQNPDQPWCTRTWVGVVEGGPEWLRALTYGSVPVKWEFGVTYWEPVSALTAIR